MTAAIATADTFESLRREDEVGEWWSAIPGYEGLYDVSSEGRIRSWHPYRANEPLPRIRATRAAPNGYIEVDLYRNGKGWTTLVHRLVLCAFIGPCPDGMEARHIDGNRGRNVLANLVYGTRSENAHDRVRHGTHNNLVKTHCPRGHVYDEPNTRHYLGRRICRACHRGEKQALRSSDHVMTAALATSQTLEALRRQDAAGEWWSARDLQMPLGYAEWRKFEDSIERAIAAATNAGHAAADHFGGADKMVNLGSGAVRVVSDYRLSRFAAYLTALNGDPRKPEIAAAQAYFVIQTRKAEVAAITVEQLDRRALARMVIEAEDARELAEARAAELAPLASFAEELILADGDYSVRQAAQALCRDERINIGERRLFAELRRLAWIQDAHRAYQRHIDLGRIRVRVDTFYDRETGEPHVSSQIRITARGLADLHRILGGQLAVVSS